MTCDLAPFNLATLRRGTGDARQSGSGWSRAFPDGGQMPPDLAVRCGIGLDARRRNEVPASALYRK